MADTPSRDWRRRAWWIGLGLVLGAVAMLGVLALPPVQGWIVRSVLNAQAGTNVEFTRMRVGPTGASAQELKLRLPNLAVEVSALRLAVSPWQLLTRRRLAVDSMEARDLQVTARTTDEPSAPFTGLLDQLAAPLDWAVAQAEAEGRFILEQPGAEPLAANFKVRGSKLTADRPGELAIEFAAPGGIVPGWTGEWKFAGTLAFTPGAKGTLEAAELRGTLQPAESADVQLPPLTFFARVEATAGGENYVVRLSPRGTGTPELNAGVQAAFTRASGMLIGDWHFETGRGLAAFVSRLTAIPDVLLRGRGHVRANARTGDASVTGDITLRGDGWERLMPELATVGIANGTNSFAVSCENGTWRLDRFAAALAVDGSEARVNFASLRPQALAPFAASAEPWARLEVSGIPLEWARPFLPGVTLRGGTIAGEWLASTPNEQELRLAPSRPVGTGRFQLGHAALPDLQTLEFSLSPFVRVTPDEAQLEFRDLRVEFERGDYLHLNVTSTVSYAELEAQLDVGWQAELPSLIAGPERPVPFQFSGRITAQASDRAVHINTATITAHERDGANEVIMARLLEPVHYFIADERLEAPAEVGTFSARALPLAWLGRFVPGLALAGSVERGTGVVGFHDGKITLHTREPWQFERLTVAQEGAIHLRDATLSLSPAVTVDWPMADAPQFSATLTLEAQMAEVAQVSDPAGPLTAKVVIAAGSDEAGYRLDSALIDVRRRDGTPLFDLGTERAMIFKKEAPVRDDAPVWFTARIGRVPLELFRAVLAPDQLEGEIEPIEFTGRADWPTANVKATQPLTVQVRRYASSGVTWLENVTVTAEPGIQNSSLVHAAYAENIKATPVGAALGSLGSGYAMYFGDNYSLPVALVFKTQIDLAQWQQQPIADLLSLPAAGLVTAGYEHDLFNDKQPGFSFDLENVPSADGGDPIAPLRATAKLAPITERQPDEVSMLVSVELETKPRASKVEFEAKLNNRDRRVNVNSTLRGEFVDVAELERLVATTAREGAAPAADATTPAADTPVAAESETAGVTSQQRSLEYPFWLVIRGRFDLELGEVARAPYVIRDMRGALELEESTLALRDLSGRTFGGSWGGNLTVDFTPADVESPYAVNGSFKIADINAGEIVAAVYPEQPSLFSGRLALDTAVTSRGTHLANLLENSAAEFDFRADGGRLRLDVPHANLASAALVFGGAVTFSPEIRALGRLIKKFADMPVEELRARGHREPSGLIALDEFRVETPQLRLSATGIVPAQKRATFLENEFELPVSVAAKDEIAVILKGMRLVGKQPGADGFFAMNRQPKLKGTLGNPDTSELFDVLAHAADKSSGTFGLLMRKLQREVAKAQAAEKRKNGGSGE